MKSETKSYAFKHGTEYVSEKTKEYSASITFKTPAGSSIWARGGGETHCTALSAALREARALKAGYEFASAS